MAFELSGRDRFLDRFEEKVTQAELDRAVADVNEETIYHWSRDVRGKLGGQGKTPHIDPSLEGDLVRSLSVFSGR